MRNLMKPLRAALLVTVALAGAGCPKVPGGVPGAGGGCGEIKGIPMAAKLNAFLQASAELDSATAKLENSVKDACKKMAVELKIPTAGDTATLCNAVSAELKESWKVSLKAKTKLNVKYTPAKCTVKADFAAEVAAKCEAKATADMSVKCEGTCGGTCNGACDGTCAGSAGTGGSGGQCNGQCQGQCNGSCSGGCEGHADVDASAECKASANVRANLQAECTKPDVDVEVDMGLVLDTSRFERAKAAVKAGLGELLMAGEKAKGLVGAVKVWASAAKDLAASGKDIAKGLGMKAACVAGQLSASARAAASISVRVDVSVSASASVGGAASGSTN